MRPIISKIISIFNPPFWENFWPNLIADAIVAFFFGFLFIKWLNFYNRPRLSLVLARQDMGPDQIKESKFNIHNNGRTSINTNEANVHFYIPIDIKIEPVYMQETRLEFLGKANIHGKTYCHYSKFNKDPIFPEREIRTLSFHHKSNENKYRIYYHFASVYGLMPKRRWCLIKINNNSGDIKVDLLPFVEFN